jgi:hypothetical protein
MGANPRYFLTFTVCLFLTAEFAEDAEKCTSLGVLCVLGGESSSEMVSPQLKIRVSSALNPRLILGFGRRPHWDYS